MKITYIFHCLHCPSPLNKIVCLRKLLQNREMILLLYLIIRNQLIRKYHGRYAWMCLIHTCTIYISNLKCFCTLKKLYHWRPTTNDWVSSTLVFGDISIELEINQHVNLEDQKLCVVKWNKCTIYIDKYKTA